MNRIKKEFYQNSAVDLAPALLGKLLCRNIEGEIYKHRVTETECYFGESDTACHAHKGKTERTKILYEEGGIAYIYLCYGIHSLLNIVTGEKGFPQAVLIRGIEGYIGPGRLTKHLQIDRNLNGEDLVFSKKLWLEDDGFTPHYKVSKRVGIDYASEEDRNRPWRFIVD
ncbi:MAG: DNA-3-methyladenine glycosylase [Bacillota bacterium]|nr:DNA-3-methyladenine glycosylase [Bacillota bacterium]